MVFTICSLLPDGFVLVLEFSTVQQRCEYESFPPSVTISTKFSSFFLESSLRQVADWLIVQTCAFAGNNRAAYNRSKFLWWYQSCMSYGCATPTRCSAPCLTSWPSYAVCVCQLPLRGRHINVGVR